MTDLDKSVARSIIEQVGGPGQPPEYGLQFFTGGLDPYLDVIERDYLASFIRDGGSSFKMVVGIFGGGKTHFLRCVRDIAWKHDFVISYVSLSPNESPFHKLDDVYKAIALGLTPPLSPTELLSGYEMGIDNFIRSWYAKWSAAARKEGTQNEMVVQALLERLDTMSSTENTSYGKAMKAAFRALAKGDDSEFETICQWLKAEGYDRYRHGKFQILNRIDKSNAFSMIRSLTQWVKQIGYSGLVILLDEGERQSSLSTKQRELLLNNLREVVDACGQSSFRNIMLFYAVPDENFLEGRTQVYEALKQRVSTVFKELNPTGVKIALEDLETERIPFLTDIGTKLANVYQVAYDARLDPSKLAATIALVASVADRERFSDIGYKRVFVQKLVRGLNYLRAKQAVPAESDLVG